MNHHYYPNMQQQQQFYPSSSSYGRGNSQAYSSSSNRPRSQSRGRTSASNYYGTGNTVAGAQQQMTSYGRDVSRASTAESSTFGYPLTQARGRSRSRSRGRQPMFDPAYSMQQGQDRPRSQSRNGGPRLRTHTAPYVRDYHFLPDNQGVPLRQSTRSPYGVGMGGWNGNTPYDPFAQTQAGGGRSYGAYGQATAGAQSSRAGSSRSSSGQGGWQRQHYGAAEGDRMMGDYAAWREMRRRGGW